MLPLLPLARLRLHPLPLGLFTPLSLSLTPLSLVLPVDAALVADAARAVRRGDDESAAWREKIEGEIARLTATVERLGEENAQLKAELAAME